MRRAILALVAISAMVTLGSGCVGHHARKGACLHGTCAAAPENCQSCDQNLCQGCNRPLAHCCCRRHGQDGEQATAAGPATGAVGYPYYSTRGPRDFLARSPAPLGP